MLRIAVIVSLLAVLAACADSMCSRAICGCWKDRTFRELIVVTDTRSQPVSDMTLFCETTRRSFGTTNTTGTTRVQVSGQTSPGCGLAADCDVTTLRTASGEVVGTVNMALLLRGDRVGVGDYIIKAIRNND